MSKPVIIVDEHEFNKILKKLDALESKIDSLHLKESSGMKERWHENEEACKIIKVSKRKMQDLRDKGLVKFRKAGKKIYYKASDLEQYLEGNR